MSNNSWVGFGASIKFTESTLDQPVGGTSLGKGDHEEVKLVGVEPLPNNLPGFKPTFEKDGLSRNEGIFYENFNKDGLNAMFIGFLQASIMDPSLRYKVTQEISSNPSLLNKLVGNVLADIIVGYRKVREFNKGFDIINVGEAGYKIVDTFDGETEPEETAGTIFATAEEAREARKEHSLPGMYLKILKIKPIKDEEKRKEQDKRIEELFFSKPKAVKSEGF
jgi:hypothetical protein